MSRRENRNSRDTDATENEHVESVESEDGSDAVEEVTEDTQDIAETIDEVTVQAAETKIEVEDESEEIEQVEVDKRDAEIEQDQGFDQQSESEAVSNSGGSGMAGAAMALSLLALVGTGYNWYDTKSLKNTQSDRTEEATVDYSGQIAGLEQQIQSLTESQEKLSAMSATVQAETETSDGSDSITVADASAAEQQDIEAQQADASAESTISSDQAEEIQTSTASSENLATEIDEQVADTAEPAEESTLTGVAASEAVSESETQTTIEQTVTQVTADSSDNMTAASMPSSDEIKQIAIQQIDEVLVDAKKRLSLSEVAQLLSIGEQRLSLAGDVAGAQAAFGIADERLAGFSDPMVDSLRKSIAGNIESLGAVGLVDKSALTRDLGNLVTAVDALAFKPLKTLADDGGSAATGEAVAETTQNATETQSEELSLEGAGNLLKSWGSKIGDTIGEVGSGIAGDLKNMVKIKKTGPMSDIVLAPEQEYFIRENMKLMLGAAQRAVLQNNTSVYQQNINQTQSLLSEFFDSNNDDVQSVAGQLTELAQINLEPELPDISNSSATLSEVLKQLASVDSNN